MLVVGYPVTHMYMYMAVTDSILVRRWSLCWRRGESGDVEQGREEEEQSELEREGEEKDMSSFKQMNGMRIEEYASSPRLPQNGSHFSAFNPLFELPAESAMPEADLPSSESSSESGGDDSGQRLYKVRKWPTAWYWQFLVLLVRTFQQSRHVILSKLNLVQTLIMTAVASIIWFQLPKHEDSISDRYGYVSTCRTLIVQFAMTTFFFSHCSYSF